MSISRVGLVHLGERLRPTIYLQFWHTTWLDVKRIVVLTYPLSIDFRRFLSKSKYQLSERRLWCQVLDAFHRKEFTCNWGFEKRSECDCIQTQRTIESLRSGSTKISLIEIIWRERLLRLVLLPLGNRLLFVCSFFFSFLWMKKTGGQTKARRTLNKLESSSFASSPSNYRAHTPKSKNQERTKYTLLSPLTLRGNWHFPVLCRQRTNERTNVLPFLLSFRWARSQPGVAAQTPVWKTHSIGQGWLKGGWDPQVLWCGVDF